MAIRYTHKEELWNSWSHAGGIVMGVVFGVIFIVMAFKGDNPWARLGVCLYLFGMLGSYVASTIYHALPRRSKWKERLRKWDHAAIYWHIAGSYSPLTLVALRTQGYWGWTMCHRGNDNQLYPTERAFKRRDLLFCGHGTLCAGSPQTLDRFRFDRCLHLDCR